MANRSRHANIPASKPATQQKEAGARATKMWASKIGTAVENEEGQGLGETGQLEVQDYD